GLINSLGNNVIAATVPDPNLERFDFLNYIARAFRIDKKFSSKGEFLTYFERFLKAAYSKNKKVLLIIDESQRLNHILLEEIRLLSNIEKQNTKLLNIFFVGQNEFNDLLWEPRNRALRQRITINYNVYALNEKETDEYIRHRLKVAGTEKEIFKPDAIREIAHFSAGFPRTINIICDHALLTGYVKGIQRIDAEIIRDCVEDLRIPKKSDVQKEEPVEQKATEKKPEKILKVTLKDSMKNQKGKPFFKAAVIALFFLIVGYVYYFNEANVLSERVYQGWRKQKNLIIRSSVETAGQQNEIVVSNDPDSHFVPADTDEVPLEEDEEFSGKNTKTGGMEYPADDKKKGTALARYIKSSAKDKRDRKGAYGKNEDGSRLSAQRLSESIRQKEEKVAELTSILEKKLVIYFSNNSNELSDNDVRRLSRIASVLMHYPDLSVNIVGYTDSSGVYSYNKSLSRFRANIVKSFLVGKGVRREQITAIGMGSINPVDSNETPDGRSSNRRVEIEFNYDRGR
ncbi:MAG: OmpA family protein, partial [Deltaproteobacteria bacterium]|nr:OmpA family protein [Deltaproteobacteria bacterium]